jgi:anti-sigma regulatory factor (Ser/Thr protein kinase)
MTSEPAGSTDGSGTTSPEQVDLLLVHEDLRERSVRHGQAIEALTAAVDALQRGVAALESERAAARERVAEHREVRLALDAAAPAAARAVVAGVLEARASRGVSADVQLLVSELVSNSVRHSGAAADTDLVVSVRYWPSAVRIDVEDAGHGGSIAARAPGADGGFGMNIVRALSERWGVERIAAGGTRVWAQIALTG